MTTPLILIGIGAVLLVAVGAVLFSRARKVRERDAVSQAIAAIQKAEDPSIGATARCKTEAPIIAEPTIKEGDLVNRVPQLISNSQLKTRDSRILISPEVPIMKLQDSLTDATAKKKASAEWPSNSYLSGSPDRSDSGGRM